MPPTPISSRSRRSRRNAIVLPFLVTTALTASPTRSRAETPPELIRIGAPAFGRSGAQVLGGTLGVARHKGWLEEEFGKSSPRFEFPGFKGGAPVVGQALANKQIEFAWQGDLLSLIGRSAGMNTRLILPFSKLMNAYAVVPVDSPIKTIKDLRGKRVSYYKGNQIHLQTIRILAANDMTEKDIRSYYLDPPAAGTALATGEIDAVFGGMDALLLRDRGIARVIYSTVNEPSQTSYNGLVAREDFIRQYPQTTARLVKVLVRAAHWASDESHRAELLDIWAQGYFPARYYDEDFAGRPWSDRLSPLLDPLLVRHYENTLDLISTLGLLPGPKFDVKQWIEPRFVDAALEDLKLQRYWAPLGTDGKRITSAENGR